MSSKVRKELSNLLRAIEDYHENANEYVGKTIMDVLGQHLNAAYAALAEPLRNCDIGTAEEQEKRWQTNCGHGIPNCKHCKVYEQAKNSGLVHRRYFMSCDCRFIWSQMPYEEGESNGQHQK